MTFSAFRLIYQGLQTVARSCFFLLSNITNSAPPPWIESKWYKHKPCQYIRILHQIWSLISNSFKILKGIFSSQPCWEGCFLPQAQCRVWLESWILIVMRHSNKMFPLHCSKPYKTFSYCDDWDAFIFKSETDSYNACYIHPSNLYILYNNK